MDKLTVCRICLHENVQHVVKNTQLRELYEKLTTIPFQTSDRRPLTLCYICHAQLVSARRLMLKCLKAEELLTEILNRMTPEGSHTRTTIDKRHLNEVSISIIECLNIDSTVPNVDTYLKQGIPITNIEINVKTEQNIQEFPENAHVVSDDEQSLPESGDDIPLSTYKKRIDTTIKHEEVGGGITEELNEAVPITERLENSTEDIEHVNIEIDNVSGAAGKHNNDDFKKILLDDNSKLLFRKENNAVNVSHNNVNSLDFETLNMCKQMNVQNNGGENDNLRKKNNIFICDIWKKIYKTKSHLVRHIRGHTEGKPSYCDVCKTRFTHGNHLKTHACINILKPFQCNVCEESFTEGRFLSLHSRLHRDITFYVCNVCSKQFHSKSALENHVLLHFNPKRHMCDVCDKSFSRRSDYNYHSRAHEGVKAYVCDICGKGFTNKSFLNKHSRMHSGEKPFACDVCNKSYTYKHTLKNHSMIHTGVSPFVCNFCNKGFTKRADLIGHEEKNHSVVRTYECN